jgi:nucleotide-binding universal stress UspA family protein
MKEESQSSPERGRVILVIDDTECGRVATERLVFLGKAGFRADVYLIFCIEVEVPPVASHKKEVQIFTRMRLRASKFVDFYKDRLVEVGFQVRQVKIFFGSVAEEVLRLEKVLNPDFIIFGMKKKSFFERLLHGDPYREIIFETKSPVVVCKPGYERVEVDPDEIRCTKCLFQ